MNLQTIYCSHQTAGLNLRERLAFSSEEALRTGYDQIQREFPGSELLILSTCNRIELYTAQEDGERLITFDDICRFLSDFQEIPLDDFYDEMQHRTGREAVRHLFQVTSSIDSMVLGEPQIVSQVKDAYRIARENNACGPMVNALLQRAIGVSGRVRSETRLASGRVSIASVAVGDFGKAIFDHFRNKQVLIIGAGEMAEETVTYLKDEGVTDLVVVNRSLERGKQLAARIRGIARPFEELDERLAAADVIVSTTGASEPIVTAEKFSVIRSRGPRKPVVILDLGAPRDFDPAVGRTDDNVFLYDIDHLEKTCERNRKAREKEVLEAQRIIDEETRRFMQDFYHRATGPVVKMLREEWHRISREEMEILFQRLSHLEPKDRQSIERSVERIVNKLLHPPLQTLKSEAREGTPHGLMEALRRLFQLKD